jgi:hypothetical protein
VSTARSYLNTRKASSAGRIQTVLVSGSISTASPGARNGTSPVNRLTWYQSKIVEFTYQPARSAGRIERTYRRSRNASATRPTAAASIAG